MSILKEIYEYKLEFVKNQKKRISQNVIQNKIKDENSNIFPFHKKLFDQRNRVSIIGEIKKASPSLGKFVNENINLIEIAKMYEENDISCLSILTDEKYFHGNIDDLIKIKKITSLPILRKDFIVDEYQIYESKLHGADCILIIISMLDKNEADKFSRIAMELNIDSVVEVHNIDELQIAKEMKSKMIGINNRNLNNFITDLDVTINLSKSLVENDKIIISESGFHKKTDIDKIVRETSINNFLIGELLMKSNKLPLLIKKLLN